MYLRRFLIAGKARREPVDLESTTIGPEREKRERLCVSRTVLGSSNLHLRFEC